VQALMGGVRESCPFLLLRVRRGAYLLRDTLMQINNAKNNGSLKKPLKVCLYVCMCVGCLFCAEQGAHEVCKLHVAQLVLM
jgi:hypothetical protein